MISRDVFKPGRNYMLRVVPRHQGQLAREEQHYERVTCTKVRDGAITISYVGQDFPTRHVPKPSWNDGRQVQKLETIKLDDIASVRELPE